MNILVVLPNDTLGGAEQYLKMVAEFYKNEAVEVIFLQPSRSKQWNNMSDKTTLHYVGHKFSIITFFYLVFSLLFKQRKVFDYVFTSHTSVTGLIGMFVKLGVVKKKFFIARESTSIFKRFSGFKLYVYKLFYFVGYDQVDLLVCQTNFMKDQLVRGYPKIVQKTKIEVIPNPIDLKLIATNEKKKPDFIPPEEYIVTAGRLIPEKGFDLLIQSFKEISDKYSNLKLIILGEGEQRLVLEKLSKDLGLENKVMLPGKVVNVYPFFKKAKLCIVSSRIEGFPNVLLQMMSQNNNVITTLCAGDMSDIPNVLKIPINDVTSMSAALTDTLSQDNNGNRDIFDIFLAERSIDFFVKRVDTIIRS